MILKPITSSEINLVADWLAEKINFQWLDFGSGLQILTPPLLKIMTQRDSHTLMLYRLDVTERPIGVVVLANVDRHFHTALLWYVLGNKAYACQGHTTRAVSKLLKIGFTDLGLHAINAWAVETNRASIRVLEKNGFHYIGRQRRCHYIDGLPYDRLLFDLLQSEYQEVEDSRPVSPRMEN